MALALADILDEQHVVLELAATTRDAAFREIVATMRVPDPDGFLREVLAREEVNTTLMPNGLAFPHARTDLVPRIVLGIGRSQEGISFGAEGRAQLIFVVGVPQRMVNDYLVCVGALARLVRNDETRTALMRSEMPAEFIALLSNGSKLLE